jgi:hypothetical protein
MELKEIAAISGKGGLFRILKPTRSGVIVESLDENQNKIVAGTNYRISILKEISVYTTTQEGSIPLEDVLYKINEEFGEDPGVTTNSEGEELKAFIKHVVPDYDIERVYVSDIKKIISWYNILQNYAPEVLKRPEETKEEAKNDTSAKAEKSKNQETESSKEVEKPAKAKKTSAPKKGKEENLVGAESKTGSKSKK